MRRIDADKPNNPVYLEQSLKLSRPGTVIVADNVVREGEVADPTSGDANGAGGIDGPESHPPSDFRMGNAIAPINYYVTAWIVNDLFKMVGFEAEIGNAAAADQGNTNRIHH